VILLYGNFAPFGRQVLFIICSGKASRSDSQQITHSSGKEWEKELKNEKVFG